VTLKRTLNTVVAACAAVTALLVWQVVGWGTLSRFDVSAAGTARRLKPNRDLFEVTVMLGLRGIILTVCLPLLAWRSWRDRSWEAIGGFLLVLLFETGLVGVLKVAVGRSFPYQGDMVLEAGFLAFPSGHAGNVVALWGFCAWYYSRRRPRLRPLLWTLVVLFTATVGVSSWLIRTHWPTDLFAGYALGALALVTVVSAIRAVEISRPANERPARATLP
jgi:membrane-associated phospholipid phosphatase